MDKDSSLNMSMLGLQEEIQNPKNTATNPFFHSSYAPLNDILNMARPLLAKHKLIMWQRVGGNGDSISVITVITHAETDEQIISDPLMIKVPADAQKAGSAITYARRYQLTAMLGIFSEDDDDGNVAAHGRTTPEKPTRKPGERFVRSPIKKESIGGIL